MALDKNEIIKECVNAANNPSTERNSMGCSEDWYNPYYAIGTVFSEDELAKRSESEIHDLIRLASAIGDALY